LVDCFRKNIVVDLSDVLGWLNRATTRVRPYDRDYMDLYLRGRPQGCVPTNVIIRGRICLSDVPTICKFLENHNSKYSLGWAYWHIYE
jgi:hypothetical protein